MENVLVPEMILLFDDPGSVEFPLPTLIFCLLFSGFDSIRFTSLLFVIFFCLCFILSKARALFSACNNSHLNTKEKDSIGLANHPSLVGYQCPISVFNEIY